MLHKILKLALMFFAFALNDAHAASNANAFSESSVQVNTVETLIKDSEFEKASVMLKKINEKKLSPMEQVRFGFFKGMVAFEKEKYKKALVHYMEASKKINYLKKMSASKKETKKAKLQASQDVAELKKSIDTFIAQTHYALKNYDMAILALRDQKERSEKSYLILSGSYWELKKTDKAFAIIKKALDAYPSSSSLVKQKAIYYSELGLVHELYLEAKKSYENLSQFDKPYFLFLVHLVKQKKETKLAQKLLEEIALRLPSDADILSELAFIYYSDGQMQAAKDLYLKAALLDRKFAYQAAEVLIKSGDLSLAQYYNGQITDQKKKTKQRFSIELKLSNYSEAYFLKDELNRMGLMNEDSILYALAYCAVKVGKSDESSKYLDQIKSADYFKKSLKLKDWAESCKNEGSWKCVI